MNLRDTLVRRFYPISKIQRGNRNDVPPAPSVNAYGLGKRFSGFGNLCNKPLEEHTANSSTNRHVDRTPRRSEAPDPRTYV